MDREPFSIHPVLEAHIRKQSEEENRLLEESIIAEGCRDPLVVWREEGVLVDGHHRKAICDRHGVPFSVVYRSFSDIEAVKAWMDLNQLGRRNLSKEDRDALIRRLAASGRHTQKEIAAKLGLTKMRVNQIINDGTSKEILHSPTIKSTSAAEELEAKQREITALQEKVHLLETLKRGHKEHDESMNAELETLRRRLAEAEARKPEKEIVEKIVEKEVTPPAIEAELKSLRKQYEEEQSYEKKKARLEEDLARLRAEGDNERAKNTFLSLLDYIHGTRTATERIKAMAKSGTLTVEHLDESERLFMAMVAAGNDGMGVVREVRGLNAEGAGLRVIK